MKKEMLLNESEFDKALRLQSAILKRLDDLTLDEMDSIVNTIHLNNFDKFNILIRVIDDLDIKSIANSYSEDIYREMNRTGTKSKKITMFPCLKLEFIENPVREKYITHYGDINIVSSNYDNYVCSVNIKKGWNVFFKKIETVVEIYDIDGNRIPPTIPNTSIHIMCYYSKVDKQLVLH